MPIPEIRLDNIRIREIGIPDVLGAIQDQIDLIAKEEERLEVIEKYFSD